MEWLAEHWEELSAAVTALGIILGLVWGLVKSTEWGKANAVVVAAAVAELRKVDTVALRELVHKMGRSSNAGAAQVATDAAQVASPGPNPPVPLLVRALDKLPGTGPAVVATPGLTGAPTTTSVS